jgi:serine/threonine protein kinase
MTLTSGTRLGPYEIVASIGAGGMGEVYRAHDSRLGREVAVKVLPPQFSVDEERLRRFEQEARAAGALNHPNILSVYDTGTVQGAPYVVSELLEGDTLRARIGDSPLPQRKAVDYATQIAKGLAAAHERGIVHRDLKPDNLFVTRDGRIKILDWGPDGESLAVVHTVDGRDRIEFPIGRTLYEGQGWLSDVAVSPKGDRLAFAEHPVAIDSRGDVAVIDLKGRRTVLSPGWEDIFGVHWTPGGDEGWFSASGGGGKSAGTDHAIFAARLGGNVRTVMSAPGSLDVQDIAPDGRVLVAHGNRRPSIMARVPGAAEERELTVDGLLMGQRHLR